MFKIGDIVRPKEWFIGHDFCFRVIKIELQPFSNNIYRLESVENPLSNKIYEIRKVEENSWEEDELELTSDVKLRYDITDINIPDYTSIVLDEMEKNLLKLKNKVKEEK